MEQGSTASYVLVGLGSVGLRAAESLCRAGVRVGRSAAELPLRLPLVAPVAAALASEGRRAHGQAVSEIRRRLDALPPGSLVERVIPGVLESDLLVTLTDRVLESPEMQHAIERIASSPELRSAITEQSAGMAREMVGGVRRTSVALDEVTEQTVRRWLRRRQPGTA